MIQQLLHLFQMNGCYIFYRMLLFWIDTKDASYGLIKKEDLS